ncbi:uncharacterized protein LTR77_010794 [Saxophila tyrrhenica]|uniref:Uncharacterized protein n=1 Tax=Saxophila tyrrhenica TaxID=1690608 RepID=A0AAV9NY09_9PEZI|nr:hypothetical protein LTR77_010794 [Saxophila tyrrhenica]
MDAKQQNKRRTNSIDMTPILPGLKATPAKVQQYIFQILQHEHLPGLKATPAEVQEYIFQILQQENFAQGKAEQIAGRWTVGTGRELRSYPPAMLRKILFFDMDEQEIWRLYMALKTPYHRAARRNTIVMALKIGVALIAPTVLCFVQACRSDMLDGPFWLIATVICMFALVCDLTVLLITYVMEDPESDTEKELQKWMQTGSDGNVDDGSGRQKQ